MIFTETLSFKSKMHMFLSIPKSQNAVPGV